MGLRAVGICALFAIAGCYDSGDGTEPPPDRFNFPVGLAVSRGGGVLYAVNSNFDLQWNGGTVQAYDLGEIRRDALALVADPTSFPRDRLVDSRSLDRCVAGTLSPPQGSVATLGEQCSPPVRSQRYVRRSVIIGAFATDLQLSSDGKRLFTPVRGDASLTWLDVASDVDANRPPPDPFLLACGQGGDRRCDAAHRAGNNPDEPGNRRRLTMPGEPFGLAQSQAGDFALITHQNDTKTSLLRTGTPTGAANGSAEPPSLQFVADGVTGGGVGIAAVPHDPDAFEACVRDDPRDPSSPIKPANVTACERARPRPAFIQTSRAAAKVDLLRLYEDEGFGQAAADGNFVNRPFLQREAEYEVVANAGNFDSRGIVIDPTPRLACKARIPAVLNGAALEQQVRECARLPARVFIANRSPASLLVGEIGEPSLDGQTYNPDRLSIRTSVPLSVGPSRLYLAPVVEKDGRFGLRVYVVCFDASTIYVFDPNANTVENLIRVGEGPFAMAFDPFDLAAVARGDLVAKDSSGVSKFRFGYVSIFRNSHVQVIDLDNSAVTTTGPYTYQKVVLNLGQPTAPKGGL